MITPEQVQLVNLAITNLRSRAENIRYNSRWNTVLVANTEREEAEADAIEALLADWKSLRAPPRI